MRETWRRWKQEHDWLPQDSRYLLATIGAIAVVLGLLLGNFGLVPSPITALGRAPGTAGPAGDLVVDGAPGEASPTPPGSTPTVAPGATRPPRTPRPTAPPGPGTTPTPTPSPPPPTRPTPTPTPCPFDGLVKICL